MSAYCLFDNLEISDPSKLEEYKRLAAPTVELYGGRYVVVGGTTLSMEGDWKPVFPVMLEFPSLEHSQRWYDSVEYRKVKPLRLASGRFNAVFIESGRWHPVPTRAHKFAVI